MICIPSRNGWPLSLLRFRISHASLASNSSNALAGRNKHQMHINLLLSSHRGTVHPLKDQTVYLALDVWMDCVWKADAEFYLTSAAGPGTAMIQAWCSGSTGPYSVRADCGGKSYIELYTGKIHQHE